jgi:hypothetical protein
LWGDEDGFLDVGNDEGDEREKNKGVKVLHFECTIAHSDVLVVVKVVYMALLGFI